MASRSTSDLVGLFDIKHTSVSMSDGIDRLVGANSDRFAITFCLLTGGSGVVPPNPRNLPDTTSVLITNLPTQNMETGFLMYQNGSWLNMTFKDYGALVTQEFYVMTAELPKTISVIETIYKPKVFANVR